MSDENVRSGRCQWCNGSHEGGPIVETSRGYWWHEDCARDNLAELEDALLVDGETTIIPILES